jgi:asparagine synthase (glutamine-hydrolysing)
MEELAIVFNGEIYNFVELRQELLVKGHVFQSHSDTEVILAAYREWGIECPSHLDGMFAFAIYDRRYRKVFMARDRAGEKPFFYSLVDGVFRFASELKGLMADPDMPRRVDPEAFDCYLSMGYVPGGRCILRGVNKLPPAHAMEFFLDSGKLNLWHYWKLPEFDLLNSESVDEITLLDELEQMLEDAVRRQLVADVPVGVLLSGGVDSSLVAAMAVRSASRVKTFTVRFPGHGVYDETEHARLIARHFHTEHIELEAIESNVSLLPLLARQFDEPMADSSMIPTYLVSRLMREHCTVALGGDGGDELFGGYSHYNRLLWSQQRLKGIPLAPRALMASIADKFVPLGVKGRIWLQSLSYDLDQTLPVTGSLFDFSSRVELVRQPNINFVLAEAIRELRIPRARDLLQRASRMDYENYLPEDILVKVDRASMINSLEVRAPFLDCRLTEFAFSRVPSRLKATTKDRKILLKKLCARLLPPEFDRQRKQGFSIPLESWLKTGVWNNYFKEVLISAESPFFYKKAVSKILDGQAIGRANTERLFALVMFELWRKEYGISW